MELSRTYRTSLKRDLKHDLFNYQLVVYSPQSCNCKCVCYIFDAVIAAANVLCNIYVDC